MPTPKGQKESDRECPGAAKCQHQRDGKTEIESEGSSDRGCPRVAKCQHQRDRKREIESEGSSDRGCPRVAKCQHQRDRKREIESEGSSDTGCPRVAKCQHQRDRKREIESKGRSDRGCPRVAKCQHHTDRKREIESEGRSDRACPRVAKCQRQEQLRERAGIGCGKIPSQARHRMRYRQTDQNTKCGMRNLLMGASDSQGPSCSGRRPDLHGTCITTIAESCAQEVAKAPASSDSKCRHACARKSMKITQEQQSSKLSTVMQIPQFYPFPAISA